MSSAYIVQRETRNGPRFHVRFRLGGRDSTIIHGGSYSRREDAETRLDEIRHDLAEGRVPTLELGLVGWVYVVQAGPGGPCKIGFARDVDARIRSIQTGNHEQLELRVRFRATLGRERDLHAAHADRRIRGEWFDLTEDDIARLARRFASVGARDHANERSPS